MWICASRERTSQEREDVEQGKKVTEEDRLITLYKAALNGDWNTAQAIYSSDPDKVNAEITNRGETALHIAALAERTHFVKELMKLMSEEGLLHKTTEGENTAFNYAVVTGNENLAKAMMERPQVCQGGYSLLVRAAVLGHSEMVRLLYNASKDKLSDVDRKDLLVPLIEADMYDIAWEMLKEHPSVAAAGLEGTTSETKTSATAGLEGTTSEKNTSTTAGLEGTNSETNTSATAGLEGTTTEKNTSATAGLEGTTSETNTSATTVQNSERMEGTKSLKGTKGADDNPESSADEDDNPMNGTNAAVVEYIKNVKRTTTLIHASETTKEYSERVEGTKTLKVIKAPENKMPGKTPLLALARKRYNANQSWFKQFQMHFFCLVCILKSTCKLGFYDIKHEHNLTDHQKARKILRHIWKQITLKDIKCSLDDFHFKPIFLAAEEGNVEFFTILVNDYPDILLKTDENDRTVFHVAVLNRQEKIFKLIHKFSAVKKLITMYVDADGNNMLHLAGKLAPPRRLGVVPGAALQLQREMMWFEEVKKAIKPWYAEAKNNDDITPGDLFEKEHEELMKEGKKWMTGTANSCTLVGTLIATVVFAAAFTVPGGNGQDTGIPIFLKEASFKVFVIFDAISLILSISSVVTFLSILTSRFRLHDFHKSLPRKLFIGLSFLLLSMVAMLAAFMAAFFVVFNHGRLLIVSIPLAVLSLVPVLLFVAYHFRLFWDLLKSICRSLPKKILCFHWG